jgi:hypothetical protein
MNLEAALGVPFAAMLAIYASWRVPFFITGVLAMVAALGVVGTIAHYQAPAHRDTPGIFAVFARRESVLLLGATLFSIARSSSPCLPWGWRASSADGPGDGFRTGLDRPPFSCLLSL